jgi:hypothetical protein
MDPRTEIPKFVISPSYISPTLNFIRPILLHHSDCETSITTPTNIPLGLFQTYRLNKLLQDNHFVRLVAFQQNTLIPFSNIMTFDRLDTSLDTPVDSPDISFKDPADPILPTETRTPSTDYIEMTDMTSARSMAIASAPSHDITPTVDPLTSVSVSGHTVTSTIYCDISKSLS